MSTIYINVMGRGDCRLPCYCEGVKGKETSTLSSCHVTHAKYDCCFFAAVLYPCLSISSFLLKDYFT